MRKIYTLVGCLLLLQLTNSLSAQVLINENFSTATGTTPPAGWVNNEIIAGGGQWAFNNPGGRTSVIPISAPFAIFDSDYLETNGEETALESPTFDMTPYSTGWVYLSFDHYFRSGSGGEYYVEVYDGASWVSVLDGTTETANPEHVDLDITSYVTGITNAQVRFRWVGDYSWYWIVDNVKVTHTNCMAVTAASIGNETVNSLDVSWTAGASETSWNIQWGLFGFTPGTGTQVGSATASSEMYTMNGLTPGTDYDVYIQADCGAGNEAVWVKVSGTTLCGPLTALPWTENFDMMPIVDYGVFPNCWLSENDEWFTDNTSHNVSYSFSQPYSGNNFLGVFYASDDYIWTPEFQLTAGKNYEFSFMWLSDGSEGWNGEVVVNSSQSSSGAEVLGSEFITPTQALSMEYRKAVYCFVPNSSGVYSFAVHVNSTWDPSNLIFDNFSLAERKASAGTDGTLNACQISGLVDLNSIITKDDQMGTWSFAGNPLAVVNDSMFNPEFVPAGIVHVNYITTGCLEDTAAAIITIYPRSNAGQDGNITGCKNEPMNLLGGLTGNVDLGGDWYNSQNQLMTTSQIMAPNFPGQYNYKYITGNGICPNDTSSVVVTVTSCNWLSVDEMALDQVNLYPNPSTGVVFIESGFSGSFNLVVMDVNGRTVSTANNAIVSGTNTVNLSNVQKGTYFFKLSNENAEKVYRVVIQ